MEVDAVHPMLAVLGPLRLLGELLHPVVLRLAGLQLLVLSDMLVTPHCCCKQPTAKRNFTHPFQVVPCQERRHSLGAHCSPEHLRALEVATDVRQWRHTRIVVHDRSYRDLSFHRIMSVREALKMVAMSKCRVASWRQKFDADQCSDHLRPTNSRTGRLASSTMAAVVHCGTSHTIHIP